jgi:hypothetical protein
VSSLLDVLGIGVASEKDEIKIRTYTRRDRPIEWLFYEAGTEFLLACLTSYKARIFVSGFA